MEYRLSILEKLRSFENASKAIEEIISQGKQVLLVGTKRQAEEPIRELAQRLICPFV